MQSRQKIKRYSDANQYSKLFCAYCSCPLKACGLSIFLLLFTVSCGVETDNEFLDAPENIIDTSKEDLDAYKALGEIPDLSLADISVRGRPYIDDSLGYNVIRTDMGTLLRGVSLSTDGGDPYDVNNLLDKSDILRVIAVYGERLWI